MRNLFYYIASDMSELSEKQIYVVKLASSKHVTFIHLRERTYIKGIMCTERERET